MFIRVKWNQFSNVPNLFDIRNQDSTLRKFCQNMPITQNMLLKTIDRRTKKTLI